MKTQADCWKALLDGKVLVHIDPQVADACLIEKELSVRISGEWRKAENTRFSHPNNWSIQKEKLRFWVIHLDDGIDEMTSNIRIYYSLESAETGAKMQGHGWKPVEMIGEYVAD